MRSLTCSVPLVKSSRPKTKMHTMHSAFKEACDDLGSAVIDYPEGRAAILYGIRAFKSGDHIEFQAAYDGDFYRPLPSHLVDVILQNGWRKGICALAAERCEESIYKVQKFLDTELSKASPDKKRLEYHESMMRHLKEKQLIFSNQIQSHE